MRLFGMFVIVYLYINGYKLINYRTGPLRIYIFPGWGVVEWSHLLLFDGGGIVGFWDAPQHFLASSPSRPQQRPRSTLTLTWSLVGLGASSTVWPQQSLACLFSWLAIGWGPDNPQQEELVCLENLAWIGFTDEGLVEVSTVLLVSGLLKVCGSLAILSLPQHVLLVSSPWRFTLVGSWKMLSYKLL